MYLMQLHLQFRIAFIGTRTQNLWAHVSQVRLYRVCVCVCVCVWVCVGGGGGNGNIHVVERVIHVTSDSVCTSWVYMYI